jgi:AcrR family transcriptional regulator
MREKKADKRKIQGAETKKRLYEVAERLFMEKSYSDVSIEDITHKAGITKGAFYVHFESKDALIAIMIADYVARADKNYKIFLESLPEKMPVSELILELTEKIADELIHTIGCENMRKIYQFLIAGNEVAESVKGYNREIYMLYYNILEKGIQRGEFNTSLSVDILSRHFVMAIRGVCYEWCIRYPDFDLREQVIEHIRLLIEGIK